MQALKPEEDSVSIRTDSSLTYATSSSSESTEDDYDDQLEVVLRNRVEDQIGQEIMPLLNIVEVDQWDWKYKKGRDKNKKVWGRFSMIFPLQHGGCTIGVLHGSHRSTIPIHLSQATRVFIPYGCFILFHARLYHYGDKTTMDCGSPHSSIRGFAYVVEEDYPIQTYNETWILQQRDVCQKKKCDT